MNRFMAVIDEPDTHGKAWPLLVNYGCSNDASITNCPKESNIGWRYLYITLGGLGLLMSIIRSFVLHSHESPKWLAANGRVEEAVVALNKISKSNHSQHRVTGEEFDVTVLPGEKSLTHRNLRRIIHRVAKLFTGPGQLRLMSCLIGIWALIGIWYVVNNSLSPANLATRICNLSLTLD